ncbi:MAG: dihydrodipicolinate reductase [Planctomycetota bacterium]
MKPRHASDLCLAQFGLGPIGIESLRLLADKPWANVIGAVDIDPAKVGQDLGALTGCDRFNGKPVVASFAELVSAAGKPDVVLHTAGSRAAVSIEQITPMVEQGVHVASTCEELLFPWVTAPAEADAFDALCKKTGARVVGTGVNPGFSMDLLPVQVTGVNRRVDSIRAKRVVDATTRRGPLQVKVGSGKSPAEFSALFEQKKAGHAGFKESAALIAHAMGWPWDDLEETLEPVVATEPITTDFVTVEPGQTRGLHQRVVARANGQVKIDLDLTMALKEPDPHDEIWIEGDPALNLRFKGGIAGDSATVAALVNAARRLQHSPAGMLLMTDLGAPIHG